MVKINKLKLFLQKKIRFFFTRLNILTSMTAADEITEDQARTFQMDLEMCYNDFNRLLSSTG